MEGKNGLLLSLVLMTTALVSHSPARLLIPLLMLYHHYIGHPNLTPTLNFCNFGVNELYYEHAKGKISKTSNETRNVYVFYQYPGDTVYIPYKYHHMVLNLSTSVAITHNYVPLRPERIHSFLEDVKFSLNDLKYQRLKCYITNNMNQLIKM